MSIIKSFSVGNGDMFYIRHNSDSFTTIDCCCSEEDMEAIFSEIKEMCADIGISRFISTHPDEDHIKGIAEFCKVIGISNFYAVKNEATKKEETDSFKKYCELRDGKSTGFVEKNYTRKWLNEGSNERGSAGIVFLWPDTNDEDFADALDDAKAGKAYNNISPIFTYSVEKGIKVMWMGDLEHDFLEKIKDKIDWPEIDVLFAPHHGRDSGRVSVDVLKKLNPQIIVIGEAPSNKLNYYSGYNTITQLSAGEIVFFGNGERTDVYVGKAIHIVWTF